jgi:hypothetical protein
MSLSFITGKLRSSNATWSHLHSSACLDALMSCSVSHASYHSFIGLRQSLGAWHISKHIILTNLPDRNLYETKNRELRIELVCGMNCPV